MPPASAPIAHTKFHAQVHAFLASDVGPHAAFVQQMAPMITATFCETPACDKILRAKTIEIQTIDDKQAVVFTWKRWRRILTVALHEDKTVLRSVRFKGCICCCCIPGCGPSKKRCFQIKCQRTNTTTTTATLDNSEYSRVFAVSSVCDFL